MDQREKDIQTLCKAVLDVSPEFWDNPNGPYEYTCPFCRQQIMQGGGHPSPSISDIPHSPDCAYLIAKDLSTGLL